MHLMDPWSPAPSLLPSQQHRHCPGTTGTARHYVLLIPTQLNTAYSCTLSQHNKATSTLELFLIPVIQRSDRTTALRSHFNFAFGSQYISGQLLVIWSHENWVLVQTIVQATLAGFSKKKNFFLRFTFIWDAYMSKKSTKNLTLQNDQKSNAWK